MAFGWHGRLLIILAAALGLIVLLGVRATIGSEPEGAAALAGFLKLDPGALTVEERQAGPTGLRLRASYLAPDGTQLHVTGTIDARTRDIRSVVWQNLPEEAGGELAASEVQTKAERFLSDHAVSLEGFTLTKQSQTGLGIYLFGWEKFLQDGIRTGDYLAVMVTPRGTVVAYINVKAPRQVATEDVKITQEEARAKALALGAPDAPGGTKWVVSRADLTLSSGLSPSLGPVWFVGLRLLDGEGRVLGVDQKLIDAFTGLQITPSRSREQGATP